MALNRGILMLLVALITGLAAVVLAARWMHQRASVTGGKVAVAAVDIPIGARISAQMVQLVDWPAGSSVPEGAFSDPAVLDGRVTRVGLLHGEPILPTKLAAQGSHGGLAAVVSEGKRAITVRVNDVIGVAGFALPGSFVDVMVNTQEGNSHNSERAISKIVLERILVLAVAQQADRDETKPKVVNAVTLEVTPEQAEKLDLARSVGNLSLVLRNETDPAPVGTHGATKETLLGIQEAAPEKSAPAPIHLATAKPLPLPMPALPQRLTDCVEMIRGGSKVTECF